MCSAAGQTSKQIVTYMSMCSDGAFCLESHYSAGKGLQFSDKLQVNIKSLKTSGSEPDVSDVNLSWVFFLTVSDKEVPAEHRQKEEGGRRKRSPASPPEQQPAKQFCLTHRGRSREAVGLEPVQVTTEHIPSSRRSR